MLCFHNIFLCIMALSRAEALEFLELPTGADPDSIRTSYKRLAQKWHPEKHKSSSAAEEKFRVVALAFKRLSSDNEYSTVNDFDMYDMYNRIVQQRCTVYTNGYSSSEEEEDSDSEEDFLSQIIRSKHTQRLRQDGLNNNNRNTGLTAEEIEQNAKELISGEEREKKKAEKRRAKKKRQREKKRQEKESKDSDTKKHKDKENRVTSMPRAKSNVLHSSSSEAESFDTTAAFFTEVKSKKKKGGVSELSVHPRPKPTVETGGKTNGALDDKGDNLDPVILRSRQLAIQGNQMASQSNYTAAIDLFTNAIKLDPKDFRFFGNRSYCFDRVQQHDRALKDAEKAITLAPEWPKGFFRKGRALAGLKLFADAEQSFMEVLKLDKNCEDATTELVRVRTHQLTEMGFTLQQAEKAIKQYGSVQVALDSLLSGLVGENSLANEIYESDDEDYSNLNPQQVTTTTTPTMHHHHMTPAGAASVVTQALPVTSSYTPHPAGLTTGVTMTSVTQAHMQPITRNAASRANDIKMNPGNPEGLTALWVGNVLPEITQTKLLQMFQKYGTVTSIRMLPEKYCAFVNFKTKEAAGMAMHGLQDQDCGGQRLLIKFPDNPVANGSMVLRKGGNPAAQVTTVKNTNNTTIITKKTGQNTSSQHATGLSHQHDADSPAKASGPINGNECYFWRTTGCQFADACHYKHLPHAKGIDKKPWQAMKE